jgi:hypothetical protein
MTPAIDIIVRWRDFKPPLSSVFCLLANALLLSVAVSICGVSRMPW